MKIVSLRSRAILRVYCSRINGLQQLIADALLKIFIPRNRLSPKRQHDRMDTYENIGLTDNMPRMARAALHMFESTKVRWEAFSVCPKALTRLSTILDRPLGATSAHAGLPLFPRLVQPWQNSFTQSGHKSRVFEKDSICFSIGVSFLRYGTMTKRCTEDAIPLFGGFVSDF